MRKYYLFIIKREYFELYYKKSKSLYHMLDNLKNLKAYDYEYGVKIFREICSPISVKLLNNYISKKIHHIKIGDKIIKISSNIEDTYLKINYSHIYIKTSVNMPYIMRIFNIYNKDIFVCDFDNSDYFWLKDYFKATIKK